MCRDGETISSDWSRWRQIFTFHHIWRCSESPSCWHRSQVPTPRTPCWLGDSSEWRWCSQQFFWSWCCTSWCRSHRIPSWSSSSCHFTGVKGKGALFNLYDFIQVRMICLGLSRFVVCEEAVMTLGDILVNTDHWERVITGRDVTSYNQKIIILTTSLSRTLISCLQAPGPLSPPPPFSPGSPPLAWPHHVTPHSSPSLDMTYWWTVMRPSLIISCNFYLFSGNASWSSPLPVSRAVGREWWPGRQVLEVRCWSVSPTLMWSMSSPGWYRARAAGPVIYIQTTSSQLQPAHRLSSQSSPDWQHTRQSNSEKIGFSNLPPPAPHIGWRWTTGKSSTSKCQNK